jgi:hypothetical protein
MPLDAESKLQLEEFQQGQKLQRPPAMDRINEAAIVLVRLILEDCPASTERTTALAYIDNAMLLAHASIARHPRMT